MLLPPQNFARLQCYYLFCVIRVRLCCGLQLQSARSKILEEEGIVSDFEGENTVLTTLQINK